MILGQKNVSLNHLSLFSRLAIVSGLFLFVSTCLFSIILVRSELVTQFDSIEQEVQEHKNDIKSIITEKAIIGDYASIQEHFRSRIRENDIFSLRWTDKQGSIVEASVKSISPVSPSWFQKIANQPDIIASDDIIVGGRYYGTYLFKHTTTDRTNAIWHNLTDKINIIIVAFVAFMAVTLPLIRFSLRPLNNLAVAAKRFGEGDYSTRVPVTKLPDLERSIQAFNAMAGIIENLLLQQKEQERLLRKSESRLMEAQRIAHIGCWELKHESGEIFCSKEIYQIIGYRPDQFDSSFDGFMSVVHPDDRLMVTASFAASQKQHTPCALICRLQTSEKSTKFVQWQWETNFNYDGNPLLTIGTIQDVTTQKNAEAEKQNLLAQLSQSQKLESIGRLAAGIAHDFNNLLTPIIGYSELIKEANSSDSRDYKYVGSIIQAAEKAKILTHQLLVFGRKQRLEMKVIDVNCVITSFYEILRRTVRENIEIRLQLSDDVLGILADQHQLTQVIMNLTVNAQDAIKGNGVIVIETAAVDIGEEALLQYGDISPGRYLMLSISDTGSGMDKETISMIFEPFYTTKDLGKGTGLGLAMVHGLIKQHKGSIWVTSEIGAGSIFKILLPIVSENIEEEQESRVPHAEVNANGCTILLVEDDDVVRTMVKELLCRMGSNVIDASCPEEALKMLEDRQQDLDLLVTDVVMPGMSGPELHTYMLKSRPGLKVLYMSGYSNNLIDNGGISANGINFIQKPFAGNELALKIEALLKT